MPVFQVIVSEFQATWMTSSVERSQTGQIRGKGLDYRIRTQLGISKNVVAAVPCHKSSHDFLGSNYLDRIWDWSSVALLILVESAHSNLQQYFRRFSTYVCIALVDWSCSVIKLFCWKETPLANGDDSSNCTNTYDLELYVLCIPCQVLRIITWTGQSVPRFPQLS